MFFYKKVETISGLSTHILKNPDPIPENPGPDCDILAKSVQKHLFFDYLYLSNLTWSLQILHPFCSTGSPVFLGLRGIMPARGQPSYIEYDASSLDVSLVDELEDFAHPAPHKGLVTTSTQESSLRPFLVPGTRARQPSCKNIAYVVEREPTTCKLPSTIVSDGREIRRYDYMCSHKDMTQAETYRAPRPPAAVTLTRPEIHSSQLIHEHLIKQNEVDFSKWLSQGNAIKSRLKHKPVKVWPLLNPTHIPYQRSQSFLIKPLSIKPHDLSYFFLRKY